MEGSQLILREMEGSQLKLRQMEGSQLKRMKIGGSQLKLKKIGGSQLKLTSQLKLREMEGSQLKLREMEGSQLKLRSQRNRQRPRHLSKQVSFSPPLSSTKQVLLNLRRPDSDSISACRFKQTLKFSFVKDQALSLEVKPQRLLLVWS